MMLSMEALKVQRDSKFRNGREGKNSKIPFNFGGLKNLIGQTQFQLEPEESVQYKLKCYWIQSAS